METINGIDLLIAVLSFGAGYGWRGVMDRFDA